MEDVFNFLKEFEGVETVKPGSGRWRAVTYDNIKAFIGFLDESAAVFNFDTYPGVIEDCCFLIRYFRSLYMPQNVHWLCEHPMVH